MLPPAPAGSRAGLYAAADSVGSSRFLLRQCPRLAYLRERDAPPFFAGGGEDASARLFDGLAAETEGRVVHGEYVLRAHLPAHLPSLFGVGVDVYVRVVRADG